VERGVRVLKDHLDLGADRAEVLTGQPRQVDHPSGGRAEQDLAAGGRVGPEDAPGRRGLAAAALPDETEGLPFPDLETDVVHGANAADDAPRQALLDREMHPQMSDIEQRPSVRYGPGSGVGHGGPSPCASSPGPLAGPPPPGGS